MAKKRTLICIHVMPSELEMFERLMIQMKKSLSYLDSNDDVTLKVTLNLNPELTNWQDSELKNGYFISNFAVLFNGIKNILSAEQVGKLKIGDLLNDNNQNPLIYSKGGLS